MNWLYTTVQHPVRIALGLSNNEYTFLDIHYKSQTHPKHNKNGWAEIPYSRLSSFMGMSKGSLKPMVDRLTKMGFMEINCDNPRQRKTTDLFYDFAYEKNLGDEKRSEIERRVSVRKSNGHRSEIERQSSEIERQSSEIEQYKDKRNKVEVKNGSKKGSRKEEAKRILGFFKAATGRKIMIEGERAKTNIELAIKVLKMPEKPTLEEIENVINLKVYEWGWNPEMKLNLRLSTIFRTSNFKNYLTDVREMMGDENYKKSVYKNIKIRKEKHESSKSKANLKSSTAKQHAKATIDNW